MTPFTVLESVAVPLPLANVDTDQLIPARFMKRPRMEGYGPFLLHDLRTEPDNPAGALDDPRFSGARIMIARRNFGSGSSREAAVYALADFGIRCVVAPSFGDIFASNAVKNGVLPACVSEADAEALLADNDVRNGASVTVDLPACMIRFGDRAAAFTVEPIWRTQLLNGWDDIDMTRSYADLIAAFTVRDAALRPWAAPARD